MSTDFSVVAIIAAYNEEDIIGQVVGHLVSQGVDVYFLDHGSTDGTLAEVQPYLGRGLLRVEQFRERSAGSQTDTGLFTWKSILRRKEALAQELEADWFIHHDADEFRESPWVHLNLREAIQAVDGFGYNAIDFELFNFRPTHDRFQRGDDVRDAFPLYEPAASYDRVQVKCWRKGDRPVDLVSTGGHEAIFPGRNVFPIRFLLRHYPIRGQAHGERKVFRERRGRFVEAERRRGWHVQYDGIIEGQSFVWDASGLMRYDPETARLQVVLCHRGVEELARVSQELSAANREVEQLRGELGGRDRDIEHLRAELGGRTEELQLVQAEVAAQTRAIEDFRSVLNARHDEVMQLQAQLEGRREKIAQLTGALASVRERVAALEGSRSWRWTAPLRAIQRWVRGR